MPAVDTADVRRLRHSALVAGVGDGLAAVALPLLAASATRDPLAVAVVVVAQHLPWAILALVLPALRHRDRRTLAGAAGSARAVAIGIAGLLAVVGDETILTIQLVAFVLGVAQALTDDAERVGSELLVGRRGNGEHGPLTTAGLVGVAVVGFPAGGFLYEVLAPVPLLVGVAVFSVAALLVLAPRHPLVPEPEPEPDAETDGDADADVAAGPVRPGLPRLTRGTGRVTAAVSVAAAAAAAVSGVLVLIALDELGLGAPAFGLLLAGLAASSLLGAMAAPWLASATSLEAGAALGLAASAAGHLGAWALLDPASPLPAVAALGLATSGAMLAAVLVRAQLHGAAGRVVAGEGLRAFHLAVWAATPAGALVGGVVGSALGVSAVLPVAAAASLAAAALTATVRSARPLEQEPDVQVPGKSLDPSR